jgi:hypothetical protein
MLDSDNGSAQVWDISFGATQKALSDSDVTMNSGVWYVFRSERNRMKKNRSTFRCIATIGFQLFIYTWSHGSGVFGGGGVPATAPLGAGNFFPVWVVALNHRLKRYWGGGRSDNF